MLMKIGVISDTHGLLRPEAVAALQGCERILHAGDVGDRSILDELRRIAPVTAVRGNTDRGALGYELKPFEVVEAGGTRIYMLHDADDLDFDPRAAGISVVITGHTHSPRVSERAGVLYLNPGSAGPRRFRLPVTVAILTIEEGNPRAEIVPLDVAPPIG